MWVHAVTDKFLLLSLVVILVFLLIFFTWMTFMTSGHKQLFSE